MAGAMTTLKIYDILGREVATLVDGARPAGYYEIAFNGSRLASGVYFYRLTVHQGANATTQVKKMMLLK